MWKIIVGFIVFAGLALFILNKGGDIDLGGEKHGMLKSGSPVLARSAEQQNLTLLPSIAS